MILIRDRENVAIVNLPKGKQKILYCGANHVTDEEFAELQKEKFFADQMKAGYFRVKHLTFKSKLPDDVQVAEDDPPIIRELLLAKVEDAIEVIGVLYDLRALLRLQELESRAQVKIAIDKQINIMLHLSPDEQKAEQEKQLALQQQAA